MKIKFGSHVQFKSPKKKSDRGYLAGAAQEAINYGANAMMLYLGAPQNARRVDVSKMELEYYEKNYESQIPKHNILVHGPYIINPSSPEKHGFAIEFLKKEIAIMNYLGIKYMVIHPGAFTKFTKKEALDTLVVTLKAVIAATNDVIICLETMSGKGTEVGVVLEDLRWVYEQVNSPRIGVCLDTCHLWDAGYDIEDYDNFIKKLKSTKIYDLVHAIHVNDSKNIMGAHKDRHANIGQGNISQETLKKFVSGNDFPNAIKILETPYVDDKPIYKKEIAMLK